MAPVVVSDVYAELDIQDPGSYYGGFKDGRAIEFGDTEFVASDWRTGEISGGSTYRYRISDHDRKFRRQLAGFTDRYWTGNYEQWLINEAARRRLDDAYIAFNGVVMDAQPADPLAIDVTLSDIVTARIFDEKSADAQRVPWRRIGDGCLGHLINVAEDLDRDLGEPIAYGRRVRIPPNAGSPSEPASADGYRVAPILLGTAEVAADAWYCWLVAGHACAAILDLSTYFVNPDGSIDVQSVIADEGTDWLVPHYAGWNAQFGGVPYRDLPSSTYGNDRRYTLIYGRVGAADPDACARSDKTLTVSLEGIEPNGDGTGDAILDRLEQWKDFAINYLANQGLESYQAGARLTSPSWTLMDGTVVPVVDEQSWDDCRDIARERLPFSGSPLEAGYVGTAYIVDSTLRSVVAEWNVSSATQFSNDRYGRMHVFTLHPTAAIKAAAPLITDQEDILVFESRIETEGQANAIPFQTDFDPSTNAYVTTGVYRAEESITNYEHQILGQTRTYPMAPGITMAFHLARLEGIRAQHKPVYITVDAPVGPDALGNSLGYLRNGDYVRYQDFRAVSNTAREIRLGQIQRCGIRISQRRCWVELLDCEDLIYYDAPPFEEGGGGGSLGSPSSGSPSTGPTAPVGPTEDITCPVDAVEIDPGDDIQAAIDGNPEGTVFCLGSGVHTISAPLIPQSGDTFIGEFGAIIDGTGWSSGDVFDAAFQGISGVATGVTIQNLVIRNMPQNGILVTDGAGATAWTVDHCEIHACTRTGVSIAKEGVVTNNWLHHNAGGNYSAFRGDGALFENNEISYGGNEQKIVDAANVIFRGNWVHHNYGNGGIWYDSAKAGILVENNTVEDNDGNGIFIEASPVDVGTSTPSTNRVRSNTVRNNSISGILIALSHYIEVYDNVLTDNFRGIAYFLDTALVVAGTTDLIHNNIHDNTTFVSLTGGTSGAWASSLSFATASPANTPYMDGSKDLVFADNHYAVTNPSAAYWFWGASPAKTFAQWQAIPQDTGGSVSAL